MTTKNNPQWEEEFDRQFPPLKSLYDTESGYVTRQDPKHLKSFLSKLLLSKLEEIKKEMPKEINIEEKVKQWHMSNLGKTSVRKHLNNAKGFNSALSTIHSILDKQIEEVKK